MNISEPRRYVLQPNSHYNIHIGIDRYGYQVIVSNYGRETMVAVFFNQSGNYSHSQERAYAGDDSMISWMDEIGLHQQPIIIEKFFHDEYRIGIEDYPDEQAIKKDSEYFSSAQIQEILEESQAWAESGSYVFWWERDFWMNSQGNVTDS